MSDACCSAASVIILNIVSGRLNLNNPRPFAGQKFGTGPQRTFGRWKPKYDWEVKKVDKLGEVTCRANRARSENKIEFKKA